MCIVQRYLFIFCWDTADIYFYAHVAGLGWKHTGEVILEDRSLSRFSVSLRSKSQSTK